MAKSCSNCKSSDLEFDPASGTTYCKSCGTVLEENTIVSEVTIQENADGSASVVGQFVSSEGSYRPYLSGYQYGMGKDSRQITLDNGKEQIRQLAGQLNLNRHCAETAFNFYKLAIGKRLSRGRKIKHIVAACLYLTCRDQKTPHMLLDFSDATQVNVFTLGKTFLLLIKELHINLPVLDPVNYIDRFAHRLDFGDKTKDVSYVALRLIKRMKRDWIHYGRRPSGLCGAALLVAARLHGFNCEIQDIVKVVHIGRDTIRKRLTEFESTPSSQLTINEFMDISLEAEHDPPAFTNNRIKAKLQQLENEAGGMGCIEKEIGKISNAIDDEIGSNNTDSPSLKKSSSNDRVSSTLNTKNDVTFNEGERDPDLQAAENFINSNNREILAADGYGYADNSEMFGNVSPPSYSAIGPAPTAASLGLRQSVRDSMSKPPDEDVCKKIDDGTLDLDGIDDEEIDKLLCSPQEVEIRQQFWMKEYGEFLKEMEEKRDRRKQELEKKEKGKTKTKKTKYISREEYYGNSRTAGEAIQKLVARQKLSNKINYEALRKATEIDTSNLNARPIELQVSLHEINTKKRPLEQTGIPVKKLKLEADGLEPVEKQLPPVLETVIEESHDITPILEEEDYEEEEEEDEDDEHMSASQLMHRAGLANGGYGGEPDDGYDYD